MTRTGTGGGRGGRRRSSRRLGKKRQSTVTKVDACKGIECDGMMGRPSIQSTEFLCWKSLCSDPVFWKGL
jgi:hypothetical protein